MFVTRRVWVHLHIIYYMRFLDFKYRYDFVRNILFDIFRMDRICVKKEAFVKLLIEPYERRLTLRLVDVFVSE